MFIFFYRQIIAHRLSGCVCVYVLYDAGSKYTFPSLSLFLMREVPLRFVVYFFHVVEFVCYYLFFEFIRKNLAVMNVSSRRINTGTLLLGIFL